MKRTTWVRGSLVAAALVLGAGSGVEAASLITGKQVKDDTVASVDLRNGSLAGRDVLDAGLTGADFDRVITAEKGEQGDDGPAGLPGVHDVTYTTVPVELGAGSQTVEISCAKDHQRAVAGGLQAGSVATNIRASAPGGEDGTFAKSWYLRVHATFDQTRLAYAVCVTG